MVRLIFVLIAIGVTIYALVDCARAGETELRGLPKFAWIAVILLLAPIGGVLWLLVSRWSPDNPGGGGGTPRVVAPDDDPDFLRSLEDQDEKRSKRKSSDDES